ACQCLTHMLFEMIPVILEELEFEIIWHITERPGLRIGLIAAHYQTTDFLLEIGTPVGIADRRDIGGEALDLLGDEILMLHRLQRHAYAGERAQLARPLPAAIDHLFASDPAVIGLDRHDPALVDLETFDADPFMQLGAMHTRTLGE